MRRKLAIVMIFIAVLTLCVGCGRSKKDDDRKITKKVYDVTWSKAAKTIKILELFPEADVDEIDCCTNFSVNFRIEKDYEEFAKTYMKKLEADGFSTGSKMHSVYDTYEVYSKASPPGSNYDGLLVTVRAFRPKYDIGYNVTFIYEKY